MSTNVSAGVGTRLGPAGSQGGYYASVFSRLGKRLPADLMPDLNEHPADLHWS